MAIQVNDAEHEELKALNLVLKAICKKPVSVTSVTSALYCVLISQKYNQAAFSKHCLQYLLQQVDITMSLSRLN